MFCLSQKVRPLDRASRMLISMAEDQYGYFSPVSLEDLCRALVSQITIPDESFVHVHGFMETVISRNRETHSQALEMLEFQLEERSRYLDDLTEKYNELAAKVEAMRLPCDEKDATIERLEAALERRDGKKICKVCADEMPSDKIYVNRCGHILCKDCWSRLKRSNAYCPFCRDVIVYTHRVYL